MVDPITIASGAATLFKGLGGIYDSWQNRQQADKINKQQYDLARNSIKYRVQDAKNAGIHPLYALGMNTMSSGTVSVPSTMGQAVGKMSNDFLALQNLKNQNDKIKAETELLQAQKKAIAGKATGSSTKSRPVQNLFGFDITPDPSMAPASDIEDESGDLASFPYTVQKYARDIAYSVNNSPSATFGRIWTVAQKHGVEDYKGLKKKFYKMLGNDTSPKNVQRVAAKFLKSLRNGTKKIPTVYVEKKYK